MNSSLQDPLGDLQPTAMITLDPPSSDLLYILCALSSAYFFGSFAGLGKWIAVQRLPTATAPQTGISAIELKRKKIFHVVSLVLFAVAVGLGVAFLDHYWRKEWVAYFEYLNSAFWILLFSPMACLACAEWFCMPKAFYRKPGGGLSSSHKQTELPKPSRVSMKLASVVLSVGLPIGAVCYRSDACAAAMLSVVMFNFVSGIPSNKKHKTNSLEAVIICAIVYEMYVLFNLGIFIGTAMSIGGGEGLSGLPSLVGRLDWVFVWFSAMPLSVLFATLLRFDYMMHAEAAESATLLIAEAVPAPKATAPGKQLTAGAMVPAIWTVVCTPFKRRYFGSALLAHMISQFIVMILIRGGILSDLGNLVYAGYVQLLSMPLIIATVITVARLHGEADVMWKYEEVWEPKPDAAEEAIVHHTNESKEEIGVLVEV